MDVDSKSKQVFEIGNNLAEKIVRNAKSLASADEDEVLYGASMLFFFCKAYKSYQAIQALWEKGFAEDAYILTRTIFEIHLQAEYMCAEPKNRARLFVEHDPVVRHRWFRRLKSLGDSDLAKTIDPQALAEMENESKRVEANYKNSHNWWGNTIYWLANQLGKHVLYAGIYWKQSNLVHSGILSTKEYLDGGQNILTAKCYPSKSEDLAVPRESTLFFLEIAGQTAKALGVDAALEIDRGKWGELFGVNADTEEYGRLFKE